MNVSEFIETGLLELYVFGKTTQEETDEVNRMAAEHKTVREEIVSIEKAVADLSFSMSPYLSAKNYQGIRQAVMEAKETADLKSRKSAYAWMGWAATVVLLAGGVYQFARLQAKEDKVLTLELEKSTLQKNLNSLSLKNRKFETLLSVVTDKNTTLMTLGGQAIAPDAVAKVYWNQQTQSVYVDASGLPEPPAGKVYQVWSLTLNPLTPTSIGLLEEFGNKTTKIFEVSATSHAQAFGITLEPAGGSASPTMEQLYVLGQV